MCMLLYYHIFNLFEKYPMIISTPHNLYHKIAQSLNRSTCTCTPEVMVFSYVAIRNRILHGFWTFENHVSYLFLFLIFFLLGLLSCVEWPPPPRNLLSDGQKCNTIIIERAALDICSNCGICIIFCTRAKEHQPKQVVWFISSAETGIYKLQVSG